MLWRTKSPSA